MREADYICGSCMKLFYAGKAARDNHCRATGHSQPTYECERCPSWFRSMDALDRHMNALNHFEVVYETPYSGETWLFGEELVRDQPVQHHYCNECDRHFINANNLKMVRVIWGSLMTAYELPDSQVWDRLSILQGHVCHRHGSHASSGTWVMSPGEEPQSRYDLLYRQIKGHEWGDLEELDWVVWLVSLHVVREGMEWACVRVLSVSSWLLFSPWSQSASRVPYS